jgi:DNA-binding MarR family transcriptional regulator
MRRDLDSLEPWLYITAVKNEVGTEPSLVSIEILKALSAVEAELEASLEPLGLSLAKLNVLEQIVRAGEPLPLGSLADRCACVRSNITQLVDRLEAEKLVVRSDDPRDRRSIRAELTAEGRSRHEAGLKVLQAADQRLLARIPDRQGKALMPLLQALQGDE